MVLCRASQGLTNRSGMSAPLDSVVRFGAFELDLRTGELRKAGVRINLPDQPFQVLKTLLDRPGELVTREELRQRLWSAETFVDFEHGLNAAVRRLRDALGDSADVPRFVETLPRRGYRFIAPVAGPAVAERPGPTPAIEIGAKRPRRRSPACPTTHADSASGARRSERSRVRPCSLGVGLRALAARGFPSTLRPRDSCWPCCRSRT